MPFSDRTLRTMAWLALGFCFLPGCSSADSTSQASPSTTPSATDSSTALDATIAPLPTVESAKLTPGTYRFSVHLNDGDEAPGAAIAVPTGFDPGADWFVVSRDGHEYLGLWTVGVVYTDPCGHGKAAYEYPGPSVRDLAHALATQKSTRATAPEPVTLSGYHGLYLELRSPADMDKCVKVADLWGDPGGRGIYSDGQVDLVWILDVDGRRLVVNAAYSAESSPSDIDKLASMVESLEFVGTSGS